MSFINLVCDVYIFRFCQYCDWNDFQFNFAISISQNKHATSSFIITAMGAIVHCLQRRTAKPPAKQKCPLGGSKMANQVRQ